MAIKKEIVTKEGKSEKVHLKENESEMHHYDLEGDLTAHLWRVNNYKKQMHQYKIEVFGRQDDDNANLRLKTNVNFQQ